MKNKTIQQLALIKRYTGWTWLRLAKELQVSSRFLRYYRAGERKSKPLEKKVDKLFRFEFRRRTVFYAFESQKRGGYWVGWLRDFKDQKALRRFVRKMQRRGEFFYFSKITDKITLKDTKKVKEMWEYVEINNMNEAVSELEFLKGELGLWTT